MTQTANNLLNATLSAADKDAVMAAIAIIRQKLPFLIDLTSEQRRATTKLGDKSRAFVNKALEFATQNQSMLPRSFDLEDMRDRVQLFEDLQAILIATNQLQDLVDDTAIQVGSELYTAALSIYAYIKASDSADALELAADDLGRRFARKSRKSDRNPAPEPPPAKDK